MAKCDTNGKNHKDKLDQLKEDMIKVLSKLDDIEKLEPRITALEERYNKLDKVVAISNLWDKIKSIALAVMLPIMGAMASYIFLT